MPVEAGGGGGSSTPQPTGRRPRRPSQPAPSRPPSGTISGGSVADAFGASVGAIPGSVRMTYLGKDSQGNSLYKFTWQRRGGGGKGGPLGTISMSRVQSVIRTSNGGWRFTAPRSGSDVPSTDEIPFDEKENANRNELLGRYVAKVGELLDRGLITEEQARSLINNANTLSDSSLMTLISRGGSYAQSPSGRELGPDAQGAQDAVGDVFTGGFTGGGGYGGGGGGGGGGGIQLPVYVGPDKRVVEDTVKGTLVSLVGTVPDHLVGPNVELYMNEHKRNWQTQLDAELAGKNSNEIDPMQSVINAIRGTAEYRTIHKLRPKSVDERTWVSDRAQQAVQGGLSNSRVEDFAITQATAGADIQDVAQAGAMAEFQATGQAPDLLENKFRAAAQVFFSRAGGR